MPCVIAPLERVVAILIKLCNCPISPSPEGPIYTAITLFMTNPTITFIIEEIAVKNDVLIKFIYQLGYCLGIFPRLDRANW